MVDVIASAPRARPAMTTIRVVRYVLTLVPDATGESQKDAVAALRGDGLTPAVDGDDDPFAFLIPIHKQVCGQSPAAEPESNRAAPSRSAWVRSAEAQISLMAP